MAIFFNDSNLGINVGTRVEENKSLDAFTSTDQVIKFLTEYCEVMVRSRVGVYDRSTLITEANHCFSTKFNHGSSEPLTKDMVLDQLRTTKYCMNIFSSLYYPKKWGEICGTNIYGAQYLP